MTHNKKVVLVTGCTTGGIGYETAKAFEKVPTQPFHSFHSFQSSPVCRTKKEEKKTAECNPYPIPNKC